MFQFHLSSFLDSNDKTGEGLVVLPFFIIILAIIHLVVIWWSIYKSKTRDYKPLIHAIPKVFLTNLLFFFVDIFIIILLINVFH